MSNGEIADVLARVAQLMSATKENPFKAKAYRRAATKIRTLSDSLDELVRADADLTRYGGIGEGIASAIREIVLTGGLRKYDDLRANAKPEVASVSDYPRLDPKQVQRVYKKLKIGSVEALRANLESGEIEKTLGARMAQHIRNGLVEAQSILLYKADELRAEVEEYLLTRCGVKRLQVVGDYRRRVEVVRDLSFVIETDDFAAVVSRLERYGGRMPLLASEDSSATFQLSAGLLLRVQAVDPEHWGLALVGLTGSEAHLRQLNAATGALTSPDTLTANIPSETALYGKFGLSFIEPELREGNDEVQLASRHELPVLVTREDIRGELHAHSTSSDGAHSIEQMAIAARDRGYEYIGITDHSQSLKIARGVSVEDLWRQIREIDRLNQRMTAIRILKSAEVDILADGTLDYPDDLLRELDYTVCSLHSRFALGKKEQTERILRAMDNRYFTILGHPTGRLLLNRPAYALDFEKIVEHAKANGCFFEINSSPNRLDLSSENARFAHRAGVKIAVSTDAHSIRELDLVRCGLDQARRAGLAKNDVLNCLPWDQLRRVFRR